MPYLARVEREFHGVGQGLFSTGLIADSAGAEFRWVFDCGSESPSVLNRRIDDFCQAIASDKRPMLDLVALSHFDRDHINGVAKLLKECSVGTLLLPYVPFAQRMVLAFSAGILPQQPLFGAFVNPVDYFAAIRGAEVDRFTFVMPSTSGNGAPRRTQGVSNLEIERTMEYPIWHDSDDRAYADAQAEASILNSSAGRRLGGWNVNFLPSGASVLALAAWEFVPYNDAKYMAEASKAFVRQAERLRNAIANRQSIDVDRALDILLRLYVKQFGGGPVHKNAISLFLFAGPVFDTAFHCAISRTWELGGSPARVRHLHSSRRCGTLYTGDGYLDTASRLDALRTHLGTERMSTIDCMQVMHHGAESNWHAGVAQSVAPDFSVFSSDPTRKKPGHPHGSVVRDFLPFGPIQVDKRRSLRIVCGCRRSRQVSQEGRSLGQSQLVR